MIEAGRRRAAGAVGAALPIGAALDPCDSEAALVYLGRNWARIVAMSFATASISVSFVDYAVNGAAITLRTSLVSVTFDILILLALSARDAREFARARSVRRARGRRAP